MRKANENKFPGLDKKGSRLWAGICMAEQSSLANAAFLRGDVAMLTSYFSPGEVDEIWITFPEPQVRCCSYCTLQKNYADPSPGRIHRAPAEYRRAPTHMASALDSAARAPAQAARPAARPGQPDA